MVHCSLPSYIGNGWGCAAGQYHLQNAACPCLPWARVSFDRAYGFLVLGLCIAHHAEPQPTFQHWPCNLVGFFDFHNWFAIQILPGVN